MENLKQLKNVMSNETLIRDMIIKEKINNKKRWIKSIYPLVDLKGYTCPNPMA
jgi:hypothetical protein